MPPGVYNQGLCTEVGQQHLIYLLSVGRSGKEHSATWNKKVTATWEHSMEENPLPLFSMTLVCFLLLSCWTPWISTVTLGSTMEFLLLFTLGSCWPEMICGGNRGRGQDIIRRGDSLANFPLLLQECRTCWCWSFRASVVTSFRGSCHESKHLMNIAPAQPAMLGRGQATFLTVPTVIRWYLETTVVTVGCMSACMFL